MMEFFANLFEGFGAFRFEGFSDDLFTENAYSTLFFTVVACATSVMFIYYYVGNPLWSKLSIYLTALGVVALLSAISTYVIAHNSLQALHNENIPYSGNNFFMLSLVGAFLGIIIALILSLVFKWKSPNCSKTPF